MADVAVVALWVGLGALASVITVYRPLRLKERLQAIRERRGVVHLALCLATPYALYFIVAPRLGWPADYIGTHRLLGHGEAGLYAVQAVRMVLYIGLAALAYALAWLYAERHRACLEEDLRRTC
jgi:hypothetical protein